MSVSCNISSLSPLNLQKKKHAVIAFSLWPTIIIETHLSQCASSRSLIKKSFLLQMDVGYSLNHLFAKRIWLPAIYGETTDVHLWWRTDDRRRIRRLAFFSFAISVSISPCLSSSCVISFSRSLIFSCWIVTLLRESWCASAQLFCF